MRISQCECEDAWLKRSQKFSGIHSLLWLQIWPLSLQKRHRVARCQSRGSCLQSTGTIVRGTSFEDVKNSNSQRQTLTKLAWEFGDPAKGQNVADFPFPLWNKNVNTFAQLDGGQYPCHLPCRLGQWAKIQASGAGNLWIERSKNTCLAQCFWFARLFSVFDSLLFR
jgi:hypothetical protein